MSGRVLKQIRALNATRNSCLGEQIKVADTSVTRMIGLLGTRTLAPGEGLLILPSQAIHTIGMAFPIDAVFIDRDCRVIGLRERIRPFRLTRVFWRARGVLELPSGTIRNTHTEVGDQLDIDW